MSQNETVSWLVIYDIADKRRLASMFKALKKVGVPVQYSVFAVDASLVGMATLMGQLAQLIYPKEDDVRAYRLPANGWRATLGNTILPEGVWLV